MVDGVVLSDDWGSALNCRMIATPTTSTVQVMAVNAQPTDQAVVAFLESSWEVGASRSLGREGGIMSACRRFLGLRQRHIAPSNSLSNPHLSASRSRVGGDLGVGGPNWLVREDS